MESRAWRHAGLWNLLATDDGTMARSRNIKPGFFTNEILGTLDARIRLLFAGLWCYADRDGRLEDRPTRIKAEILPYDDLDVDAALDTLATTEPEPFIARYEVDGRRYIQVIKFSQHQSPHGTEKPSVIPEKTVKPPLSNVVLPLDNVSLPLDNVSLPLNCDHRSPPKTEKTSVIPGLPLSNVVLPLDNVVLPLDTECLTTTYIGNQESGIRNQESGIRNPPKGGAWGKPRITADMVPVPEGWNTGDVLQAIRDWLEYKTNRGEAYKDAAYLGRKIKAFASSAAFIAAVDNSIGNNYAGIYPAKDINAQPKHTGSGQRYRGPLG